MVVREADSLSQAFPDRLESDFMRCGPGDEPARVEQVTIGDLTVALVEYGFPVRCQIESKGDVIAAARIQQAPAGARWTDTSVTGGQIRSMGPKSRHLGINPAGVSCSLVVIPADLLRESADLLGHSETVDNLTGPLPWNWDLNDAFNDIETVLARPAEQSICEVEMLKHHLVHAIAGAAQQDDYNFAWSRSFAKSDRIVDVCVDFARSTSTFLPRMVDLCRVTQVSERRVRSAFRDVTGKSPNRYFHLLALNEAQQILQQSERDSTTVTDVAYKLGIHHLSRFAKSYRGLFDENPSDTLQA
jgi:AraC-like DNA-binding protein